MLLNDQLINDQITTEIKKYIEKNDNNNSTPQKSVRHSKGVLKGRHTGLPQERRTISYE